MSYRHLYPASSVFQSKDYTYDERDATTVLQMPAAFNDSVNNGYDTASFSQKASDDFKELIRRVQNEEYITNSPQMNQSQGATGYGASMATSHFNNNGSYDASAYGNMPAMGASMATSHHNNNGGYDASAYGNMPAMGAGFADGQLAFANNLQLNTAVPAHASTWAVEDAFPMDDFTMAASGMTTYPPAPAVQYSYAEDNNEYQPPNEPPPGYHPHTPNDVLDSYVEPTYVPAPVHSGPMLTGADACATYHQPAPVYYPGPTPTVPASAPVTYNQPAPPDFMASADWLSTQPQQAQSPVHYAQPNVGNAGYAVDPRQLHWSSNTTYDTYAQSPGTPSLGYSSGSSATSASPATPTSPAFPTARVTGKRNAVDAGFDPHNHHHGGTAQISAHPHPRPAKRSRVEEQAARVAMTVDPHTGITNQTDVAALTLSRINSVASGRGTQVLANITPEVLPQAGAGPSMALPETVSPVQEQEAIPLWKQEGLTVERARREAESMNNEQLRKNLTEAVIKYVLNEHEECEERKRWDCKWPGCKRQYAGPHEAVRHIGSMHLSHLKEPCPRCGREVRKDTLSRHIGRAPCRKREAKMKALANAEETSGNERQEHGGLEVWTGDEGDVVCGTEEGRIFRGDVPFARGAEATTQRAFAGSAGDVQHVLGRSGW